MSLASSDIQVARDGRFSVGPIAVIRTIANDAEEYANE
jgi:hypothetical protein